MKQTSIIIGAAMLAFGALASAPAVSEELRIGLSSEPTSIDPHFHNLTPNNSFAMHMFESLVKPDQKQTPTPGLAVSWKPLNPTTWEFKLRKGVKFHDGSPFTADDVVFTFERAPNVPNSPSSFGTYLKGKTAKKIDDHTVHIVTPKPYPLMVNDMMTFGIISKKAGTGASTADFNSGKAAIGTGPYKFVSYTPGDSIVLEGFKEHWAGAPKWSKVTFKPIKSGPSRLAALLAGDVDMINAVPTADIERLKKNDKVALHSGSSNRVIYLHMDRFREDSPFIKGKDGKPIKNPLFNLKVRQAISMAINRDAIVSRVMEGVAIPAGQLLPAGFFGVSPALKPVKYNPNGAKSLLKEAGFPDGFQMRLHGPNDRYINDAKIAEAIAQMLTRIGIKTDVETMSRSVYFKRASRGGKDKMPEFSFILVGWGAGSGEASSPLKSLIHSYDKSRGFGASNRGRYANPEVDKTIEDALVEVDAKKRENLLAKATELAINDVAIIPLHYQVNTWATRTGLKYEPRTDERSIAMGVSK